MDSKSRSQGTVAKAALSSFVTWSFAELNILASPIILSLDILVELVEERFKAGRHSASVG